MVLAVAAPGTVAFTLHGLEQVAIVFAVLAALAPPLGRVIAAVMTGTVPPFLRPFALLERGLYRVAGVNTADEMPW